MRDRVMTSMTTETYRIVRDSRGSGQSNNNNITENAEQISQTLPRRREWRKGMRSKKKKHQEGLLRQHILQGLVLSKPDGEEKETRDSSGKGNKTRKKNKESKIYHLVSQFI